PIRAVVEGAIGYLEAQYGTGAAAEFVRYAILNELSPGDDMSSVLNALQDLARLPQIDALDTTDALNFELSEDSEVLDEFEDLLRQIQQDEVFQILVDQAEPQRISAVPPLAPSLPANSDQSVGISVSEQAAAFAKAKNGETQVSELAAPGLSRQIDKESSRFDLEASQIVDDLA
ncbi:MAG: hypothetical protein AAF141_03390, partial [Pseudomonadota bacterium]